MSIVEDLYNKIDEGRAGKNIGLKTGLPKLDWYTGGFQKGIYRLIFGQSGSGKSSFVIFNSLYSVLKNNPNANILQIYFSLEMSSDVLLSKLLSLYLFDTYGIEISHMDLMSVRNPLPDIEYQLVQKGKMWLESIASKLIIFDKQLNADSFYGSVMEVLKERGTFSKTPDGRKTIYTPNDNTLIINILVDHAGLLYPQKGRTKKEEIDLCSAYCVRFREVCGVSIDFLMQENRNAGSVDRRKMELSESTAEDIKESGNAYNDCNICIAVYYPLKYQLRSYRGYRVLDDSGECLGSAIRGIILLKNRFGSANKVFCTGFQGSIGRFVELPSPDQIDYSIYQSWKDDNTKDETKTDSKTNSPIIFKF